MRNIEDGAMDERVERLKMLRVAAVAMCSEFGEPGGPPEIFRRCKQFDVSQEHRP